MRNRTTRRLIGLAAWLLLALAGPSQSAEKAKTKAAKAEAAEPQQLVWPLPPAAPRMRWVTQITDLDEFKSGGRKKRNWVERVAGERLTDNPKLALKRPYGIGVDSRGRIYVADSEQRTVFVLSESERRVDTRGGTSRAPLALPVGIALDEKDRLFVSDSYLHAVTCFDPEGQLLAQFGTDKLARPGGLAIDRERNRLYVADAKAHRVAVFNSENFGFERYIGGPSTPGAREAGRFAAPTNVAVGRQGNLYVTDTWNHRIQIFDTGGRFLRAFGTHGVRPGDFVRPKGIALDSEGHIYVTDAEFNNFQVFSPDGQPLLAVGGLGGRAGEFALIAGIFIDSEDRIYTTEQAVGRVQVFKYLPQTGPAAQKEVNRASK